MFLQRIPYRSMRRQKIRNWLLFALRCLGLILLAAAFARPFFDRTRTQLRAAAINRSFPAWGIWSRFTLVLKSAKSGASGPSVKGAPVSTRRPSSRTGTKLKAGGTMPSPA